MNGALNLDYAIVANDGEHKAHVLENVAWRVIEDAGNRRVISQVPRDAVCGWPIALGAEVLPGWGASKRCVPCEIVARYRGWTRLDAPSPLPMGGLRDE